MTKTEQSDQLLAQVILLERLLLSKTDDLCEVLQPPIKHLVRSEVRAISRTHGYFYEKLKPVMNVNLFEDFSDLEKIIDNFFNHIEE